MVKSNTICRVVGLSCMFQESGVPYMRKAISGNALKLFVGEVIHFSDSVSRNVSVVDICCLSISIESGKNLIDEGFGGIQHVNLVLGIVSMYLQRLVRERVMLGRFLEWIL